MHSAYKVIAKLKTILTIWWIGRNVMYFVKYAAKIEIILTILYKKDIFFCCLQIR